MRTENHHHRPGVTSVFLAAAALAVLLLAGCATSVSGPAVFYSYANPAEQPSHHAVYIAAFSDSANNQPIAMTVLDPVSGRALDTFPLALNGTRPCGISASRDTGNPVRYGILDDRYIPFTRWEDAAQGRGSPYRVRIYFKSDRGVIWEAEVMARYSGCATK